MATDRDDEIARRYRTLATEEPGAALDDAILAKSRRAVGARPGGVRRWGPPLSIAAVLVLASGVVIRMQVEKPGIETSTPVREEAVAPPAAPPSLPDLPSPQTSAAEKKRPRRDAEAPAAAPREDKRLQEDRFVPEPPPAPSARSRAQQVQTIPASTPPPSPPSFTAPPQVPAIAPPAPAPQRAPLQMNAAPAAAHAPSADIAPATAGGHAKEVQRLEAGTLDKRAAPASPDVLIDRIAELRAAGRDDEADRALEDFRRAWPGYRFTDAQWEKVRRRAP